MLRFRTKTAATITATVIAIALAPAVSVGLSSNGTLVEVLASKSGSWTMIYTKPDGASCVIATGQSWEDVTAKAARPAA